MNLKLPLCLILVHIILTVHSLSQYEFGLVEAAPLLAALAREDVMFMARLGEENKQFDSEEVNRFIQGTASYSVIADQS